MGSLEAIQAANRHEEARRHADLWAAIRAILDALGDAVPQEVTQRAQAALLLAGRAAPCDFTDAQLFALAQTGGVREWRADMGEVREGEIIAHGGLHYAVMPGKNHVAREELEPGAIGGATLFRPIRDEPDPQSEKALLFMPGERVPFGAKRRDPVDGKVYTPVKEMGAVLYDPHHPGVVPSEYKLAEDAAPVEPPVDPEPEEYPSWDSLEDNHAFAVGDRFTDGGKTWEAARVMTKQESWRPPALAGDFYTEI